VGGVITVAALFTAALGTVWAISSQEQRAAALSAANGLGAAMGLMRDLPPPKSEGRDACNAAGAAGISPIDRGASGCADPG
jgi:hypothetical protein